MRGHRREVDQQQLKPELSPGVADVQIALQPLPSLLTKPDCFCHGKKNWYHLGTDHFGSFLLLLRRPVRSRLDHSEAEIVGDDFFHRDHSLGLVRLERKVVLDIVQLRIVARPHRRDYEQTAVLAIALVTNDRDPDGVV
jgi:hypothetical protein